MISNRAPEWGELIDIVKSKWIRNQRIISGFAGTTFTIFGILAIPPILNFLVPGNNIKEIGWIYSAGFIFAGLMFIESCRYSIPIRIYSKGLVLRSSLFDMMRGHNTFIPYGKIGTIYRGRMYSDPFIYLCSNNSIVPIDKREFDDLNQFIEIVKKYKEVDIKWGIPPTPIAKTHSSPSDPL